MTNLISPEERLQKRINSLWVRQQPLAVPSYEDLLQRNRERAPYIRKNREYEAARKNSLFFDYNDPNQVNSIVDVLFKNAKEGLNPIKLVADTADLFNRGTIKPLMQGNVAAAGLNAITNFSEVMDVLALPVKGAIMGGEQGFKDALNRKNFDYNTGNFWQDMMAEIASDPLTWVSLGSWGIGKAAIAVGQEALTKSIMKTAVTMSDEVAGKLAKRALNTPFKNEKELTQLLYRFEKGEYVKALGDAGITELVEKIALHKTNMQVLKAAKATGRMVDTLSSVQLKAALATTSGLAPLLLAGRLRPGLDYAAKQFRNKLMPKPGKETVTLKDFVTMLPELLVEKAAMELTGMLELDMPVSFFDDLIGEISHAHIKDLNHVYTLIAEAGEKLDSETLIQYLDEFAVTEGYGTFKEYRQQIMELAKHKTMSRHYSKLKRAVDKVYHIYNHYADLQARDVLQHAVSKALQATENNLTRVEPLPRLMSKWKRKLSEAISIRARNKN